MPTNSVTRIRVGVFVLIALIFGAIVTFAIGNQDNLFASKTRYEAAFDDVAGLQVGSPVRLAGVAVGTVESVAIDDVGSVRVKFSILEGASKLIRGPGRPGVVGSTVAIGSKGMLGDKLLDVSVGDSALPQWDSSNPLPTLSSDDLFKRASSVIGEVGATAHNLRLATDPFADQEFSNDLKLTARNLAVLTGTLAHANGTINRVLTDEALANDVALAVKNFAAASREIQVIAKDVRALLNEVRYGDGSAHALIYGDEGRVAVKNFGDATGEVALMLNQLRTKDGGMHDLIYGTDQDNNGAFTNLQTISADLAVITRRMRDGEGTIGALLADPSVYEDVKRMIGDLERNEILRALVRYSIRHDEDQKLPVVKKK